MRPTSFNTHGLPPIVTSNRPQAAPRATASPIAAAAVAGSSESACRNSSTSPVALPRAGVHLRGAPGGGDVRAVGEQPRDQQRRVAAAAVDDDHFVALRAQRLQRRQRGGDDRGFLERGMMMDRRTSNLVRECGTETMRGMARRHQRMSAKNAAGGLRPKRKHSKMASTRAKLVQMPICSNLRELVTTRNGRNDGGAALAQHLEIAMSSTRRSGKPPTADEGAPAHEHRLVAVEVRGDPAAEVVQREMTRNRQSRPENRWWNPP